MKSPLHELLEQKRHSGRVISEGAFRIDAAKARRKLEAFQLEKAGDYLVKFHQLAHLLKASSLNLIIGLSRNSVSFPCAGEELHELSELPSVLLEDSKASPVLSHFLTGLRTSLARHRRILCSLKDQPVVSIDKDGADWYGWPQIPREGNHRLTIQFFRKNWFQGFRELAFRSEEHLALSSRGVLAAFPINLDGRTLERGWSAMAHNVRGRSGFLSKLEAYLAPTPGLPEFSFPWKRRGQYNSHGDGLYWRKGELDTADPLPLYRYLTASSRGGNLRCGMSVRLQSSSTMTKLYFNLEGALSEPVNLDLGVPNIQVVVSGEGLRTDLSEFKIVENQDFLERVSAVRAAVAGLKDVVARIG